MPTGEIQERFAPIEMAFVITEEITQDLPCDLNQEIQEEATILTDQEILQGDIIQTVLEVMVRIDQEAPLEVMVRIDREALLEIMTPIDLEIHPEVVLTRTIQGIRPEASTLEDLADPLVVFLLAEVLQVEAFHQVVLQEVVQEVAEVEDKSH